MGFFATLKAGQQYLDMWPKVPKLGMIFPENRVMRATRFGQRVMPFLAVFALVWAWFFAGGGHVALSVAVLTALFALLLPLQGLYWLGRRSQTPLDSQSAVKFWEVFHRLQMDGAALPTIGETPCYRDLARVLKKADETWGSGFWAEI